MPREIVTLQCGECKDRNYSTTKNRKTTTERLEFNKFCKKCRKHTPHKEVKKRQLRRGVSSTVKLSVSKTELGGSNPSAPARVLEKRVKARSSKRCQSRRRKCRIQLQQPAAISASG